MATATATAYATVTTTTKPKSKRTQPSTKPLAFETILEERPLTDPTLTTDTARVAQGKPITVFRYGCDLAESPLALVENTVLIAGLPFGGAVEVVYLYYVEEGEDGAVRQHGLVFY